MTERSQHSGLIRGALENSHARMCGDGHAWRECAKCRDALAALDWLEDQLEDEREKVALLLQLAERRGQGWVADALARFDSNPASTPDAQKGDTDA